MPRLARAVAPGYPHHVLQRGNYRQTVFEEDNDYRIYLELLKDALEKYELKIWAYCLMKNHVHYVCVPMTLDALAKTFNTVHMRYAQYFNEKKGLNGHLWQGRFYSTILDDRHAYEAVRYIENNPYRHNLVEKAHFYPWSSARSHIYVEENPILKDDSPVIKSITDWQAYIQEKSEDHLVEDIRRSMKTGRPCGDSDFIRGIEVLLNRKLVAAPRGRPRKVRT